MRSQQITYTYQNPIQYMNTVGVSYDRDDELNNPTSTLMLFMELSSSRATIKDVMDTFTDFKLIFDQGRPCMRDFMSKSYSQTIMSNHITEFEWVPSQRQIMFGSDTSQLSETQIRANLRKQQELKKKKNKFSNIVCCRDVKKSLQPVGVQIFNISWLNQNEIKDFFYYLADKDNDDKIYENDLIVALLIEQDYTVQIWWVFAIYLIKIFSVSLYYFLCFGQPD
jgi:hypothetical protein